MKQLLAEMFPANDSALSVIAALAVVGSGLAFAIVHSGYWLSQVFLASVGLATLSSALVATRRLLKSQSGKSDTPSETAPPLNV